jgi:GTP-binding protein LepA
MWDQRRIRNFCIIAHIDHGKSTLADRLLEFTRTIDSRQMVEQVLDSMELERERGITIKARAVRMIYTAEDGQQYQLNLVDTPGHVDFSYEVSRSMAATEGALLVVDASQGIEAQTLANAFLAMSHNLRLIPVVNKIDLPNAEPDRVAREIEEVFAIPREEVIFASAKEGIGTQQILEAIVRRIPPPAGNLRLPLRGLIFDSHYDPYKGVIAYVRIVDGHVRVGQQITLMATGKTAEVLELGTFRPSMCPAEELSSGEVGYIATGLKVVSDCRVGDTITLAASPADHPLPGYDPPKPMVFAGLYPVVGDQFSLLRDALEKLKLNDASLSFEPESSLALGFGFRCGFLGLLHMEIVKERIEREYGIPILITAPSVEYHVLTSSGDVLAINNPAQLPRPSDIVAIEEPWVHITVVSPSRYIGAVMELVVARRGELDRMEYIDEQRVVLSYHMPLSELIVDFYDQLKSRTQGYASLDYSFAGYRSSDLIKVDILVHGQVVDALSFISHRDKAYARAKVLVERLRELIPRQLFEVPIQAAIGSRVIARETIRPVRKNVLDKCYGGDVTRKRKLLEKQKEGKARLKMIGRVEVPQEAFLALLTLPRER